MMVTTTSRIRSSIKTFTHGFVESRRCSLKFCSNCAQGDSVPILFPLGKDGHALVTSLRLSLRFRFSDEFMYIDEEIYDAQSGDLIQTIGQSLVCDRDSKQWLLNAGRYRVYGVSDSVMATSTEQVTPHHNSIGTVQLTPATRVKVEHAEEVIIILSDDSDGNSPAVASPIISPLVNCALPESSQSLQFR
jgi:hypothetical protein